MKLYEKLGVKKGDVIIVRRKKGVVELKAEVHDEVLKGVACDVVLKDTTIGLLLGEFQYKKAESDRSEDFQLMLDCIKILFPTAEAVSSAISGVLHVINSEGSIIGSISKSVLQDKLPFQYRVNIDEKELNWKTLEEFN